MRLAYRRLLFLPLCAAIPRASANSQLSCCKFDKSHQAKPGTVAIGPARVILSAFA